MLQQFSWDYFCKTGDIDGYLLYKSTQTNNAPQTVNRGGMVETANGTDSNRGDCAQNNPL